MRCRVVLTLLVIALVSAVTSTTSPALAQVTEESEAVALLARARKCLAGLGIVVERDILLKLRTRAELEIENNSQGGRTIELNGFYQPYNPECIWVASGTSEMETLATLSHELTHAWQSTHAPQQDRKLAEGFARWCEYHVLRDAGEPEMASALRRSADPDYGGGLRFLLELERSQGFHAVVEYATTKERCEP
jgi:hypothetical protein